ncbi:MAG: FMN-binding protein [Kiritimatiellaeota bacterium]|nr:FMN-binding protein [Kiritimatiellota bacterium]
MKSGAHPIFAVVFMMGIAALFGAAVTGVHLATARLVERNTELLYQNALVQVFDLKNGERETNRTNAARLTAARIDSKEVCRDPETGWTFQLIKAYADDSRTRIKAYGFRFRGLGFWAPIEGILALSPDLKRTVGLVILRQTETPGLGGRVAEPVFTRQFAKGLAVEPPLRDGKRLVVSGTAPTPGSMAGAHHVQAITGATQTSMAMDRVLNDYLARFFRAMAAREE